LSPKKRGPDHAVPVIFLAIADSELHRVPCPGEAVIEDHDLVSSPLPFAYQPGTGLQLRAEAFRSRSGLLQLQCDLAQLTLRLRAETAQSHFLHSVCDRSNQQLAAEMR